MQKEGIYYYPTYNKNHNHTSEKPVVYVFRIIVNNMRRS